MKELDDLERYFQWHFDQLKGVCEVESPWIFVCLSVFIEYLANMTGQGYAEFIAKRYPTKYRDFKYKDGKADLPKQICKILRNGLVHRLSLTPKKDDQDSGARQRSVHLDHRKSGTQHLEPYGGDRSDIDAPTLIAEDFLEDTKNVALGLIRTARDKPRLAQQIITFITESPPIAGLDQGYFWLN